MNAPAIKPKGPQWSEQQCAIFSWFENGTGNLVVRARAGTGKTTTIIEGVGRAPENRILVAAFNKRIAVDLEKKIRWPHVEAKTLHSLGFGIVRRAWEGVSIDNREQLLRERAAESMNDRSAPSPVIRAVANLATLLKQVAPMAETGVEAHLNSCIEIAIAYDCLPPQQWANQYSAAAVTEAALRLMEKCTERAPVITFTDMLWLPVRLGWIEPRYDLVCIDEAQDMNPCQLRLAMGIARGRVAVVGDDRQAIYGFRGADSGALNRLKVELDAGELGLTTTYRCASSIVAEARKLVGDYQAAPDAPLGEVRSIGKSKLALEAEAGDFILSRINAPLVSICLGLIRMQKRARIEGKDIGAGLLAMIRQTGARTILELEDRLDTWLKSETKAASKMQDDELAAERLERANDRVSTLHALAEGLTSVRELETRTAEIFDDCGDEMALIVCSSVHKSKGLERDRVFVLADTLRHWGEGAKAEERNIAYVAITRAKSELVYVWGDR